MANITFLSRTMATSLRPAQAGPVVDVDDRLGIVGVTLYVTLGGDSSVGLDWALRGRLT